jgi:predicted lipid-binding transport protein (Tim44 family)
MVFMSAQVIEVLIFAVIAFFIISRLISIIGTSDEDNQIKKSRFGERSSLKDVTEFGQDWSPEFGSTPKNSEIIINKKLLSDPNDKNLISQIQEIYFKDEKFSLEKFVKNASRAWRMILESLKDSDNQMLEELVDKRFIDLLKERSDYYAQINLKSTPDVKISDVTFFGNNIMIKCIFNIQDKEFEEWTFSKTIYQNSPIWYLSNIERVT